MSNLENYLKSKVLPKLKLMVITIEVFQKQENILEEITEMLEAMIKETEEDTQ